MAKNPTRSVRLGWRLLAAGVLLILKAGAQEPEIIFTGPPPPIIAGQPLSVRLSVLNGSSRELSWTFPRSIACRVLSTSMTNTGTLELQAGSDPGVAQIAPGAFARAEYKMAALGINPGQIVLDFPDLVANRLVLQLEAPSAVTETAAPPKKGFANILKGVPTLASGQRFEPVGFFKEHIFPYEPFYFVAGTKSPNAKFQVSIRYQLLNHDGPLASKAPPLEGFNIGYTQTSLWDWNRASAPFFDSSYKPELLYLRERVLGGGPTNWYRLDLQGGVQHESNGKDGDSSRSLNITYLRPTFTIGSEEEFHFTLMPRAWVYLGDLSDNPDIARYRGYVDLRAILAYKGLQLSAFGRMGNHTDRGSVQVDLTYPLRKFWGTFSVYFHVQYFNGFGESLLDYNERSTAWRAGFSLYR
jgi:phospholipase A1